MSEKKNELKKISLDDLCLDEKKQITAELISRGLSAKQVMLGIGIKKEQIETWLTDKNFKGIVENLIQGRLIKAEQAKIKSDEILLKGSNVLSVLMGAIINMTGKMSRKVSELALDDDYDFSKSDPDTVFKLIGLMREIRSEIDNVQIRSLHLQSDSTESTTNPMNANFSAGSSIRVIKIIEKTRELAIKENIPLEKAQRIIMQNLEVTE